MALKTLMLRKRINDASKALEDLRALDAEFETREKDLEASIEEVSTEEERDAVSAAIDEFEAEKKNHEEKKADLERQVQELEAELQEEEAEQDVPEKDPEPAETEERKENKKMDVRSSNEYLRAYARMIRTSLRTGQPYDETECRELLKRDGETPMLTENVSGVVPVPTYVEGRIRTAWERNGIMDLVTKTFVKGNLKIGFEFSATGATKHTEGGEAVPEEEVILGVVTLIASNFKKYLRVSDEALELSDQEFLDYIYDEMAYQIAREVSKDLLTKIAALDGTGDSTHVPVGQYTGAPALDVLAQAVATLSDEAEDNTAVMNKKTWAALVAAQAAGNYAFDPFAYVNRLLYNSNLKAYADADASDVYMIVGDFRVGAHANFPAGADIKYTVDPYTDAERDLVKIVGRQFVGIDAVAPFAFAQVIKPSTSA